MKTQKREALAMACNSSWVPHIFLSHFPHTPFPLTRLRLQPGLGLASWSALGFEDKPCSTHWCPILKGNSLLASVADLLHSVSSSRARHMEETRPLSFPSPPITSIEGPLSWHQTFISPSLLVPWATHQVLPKSPP